MSAHSSKSQRPQVLDSRILTSETTDCHCNALQRKEAFKGGLAETFAAGHLPFGLTWQDPARSPFAEVHATGADFAHFAPSLATVVGWRKLSTSPVAVKPQQFRFARAFVSRTPSTD